MSTLSSSHTVRKPPWYLSASLLLTGYRYELKHICGGKLARNARNNIKYVRFVVQVCVLVEDVNWWCPLVFVDRRFCQTKLSWLLYRNRTEAERMENIRKSYFSSFFLCLLHCHTWCLQAPLADEHLTAHTDLKCSEWSYFFLTTDKIPKQCLLLEIQKCFTQTLLQNYAIH